MAKYKYQFQEESGKADLYVSDLDGGYIWEAHYPEYYESCGEMLESATIFEMGVMSDSDDIEGLEKHLKAIGVLKEYDEIYSQKRRELEWEREEREEEEERQHRLERQTKNIDEVLTHYVWAALWSGVGDDDVPLAAKYSIEDIDEQTLETMRNDIQKFIQKANWAIQESGMTDEELGHDLWLTRNHHGAGFFDRGYDSNVEEALMETAHELKGTDLYVGDDGKIYAMGSYAAGGALESKLKRRMKDSFELPFQLAVYVPSTKNVDVIITKKEMEKRIDDTEKLLSQLFGGYSAVQVEGGFESTDKGLVQEQAVRVVAYAAKENEQGIPFEQSFESLINQVKSWCKEWSQQSIGVEFENDLFYVNAETKFKDGGYMADGGQIVLDSKVRIVNNISEYDGYKGQVLEVVGYDDGGYFELEDGKGGEWYVNGEDIMLVKSGSGSFEKKIAQENKKLKKVMAQMRSKMATGGSVKDKIKVGDKLIYYKEGALGWEDIDEAEQANLIKGQIVTVSEFDPSDYSVKVVESIANTWMSAKHFKKATGGSVTDGGYMAAGGFNQYGEPMGFDRSEYDDMLQEYDRLGAFYEDAESDSERARLNSKMEELEDKINRYERMEDGGMMARGGRADEYETYHDTLAAVLSEADKFVENRGYTFVDESYFPDVTSGGIPYGHTAKVTRGIQKEGRKKQDVLILAIYRMDSGKYELTMYTSYEHGGEVDDDALEEMQKKELQEYLDENGIYGYTNRIHRIMTGKDSKFKPSQINKYLQDPDGNGFGIYGYTRGIESIYDYSRFEDGGEVDSELLEFTIPNWALTALINDDISGLEEDDLDKLNKFTFETIAEYGNANFMMSDESEMDLGFKYSNDIDNLGSDCYILYLRPSKVRDEDEDEDRNVEFGGYMAKGGNVASIEKRVAEVNALIKEANEKDIEVKDTRVTWQSPMRYEPLVYKNGILYIKYEELDLYSSLRGEGRNWEKKREVIGKHNKDYGVGEKEGYAQKGALTDIARMYRTALNQFNKYGYNFADGGSVAEGNADMLRSNVKAVKHHSEELENELHDNPEVEAWVVAKGERAATDLSDITHYLDGKK